MTQRYRLLMGNLLTAVFVGVALVVSISDRVGAATGRASRFGARLLTGLERVMDVDVIDRADLPFALDAAGHAALWGFGTLLSAWYLRRLVPVLSVAAGMFALSLAVEAGQHFFSLSRTAQFNDAVANLVGISLASFVVGGFGWAADRAHGKKRRRSRPPQGSSPSM